MSLLINSDYLVGRGVNETKENTDRNRTSEEFNSTMKVVVRNGSKHAKKTRKKSAKKSVLKKPRKRSKVKNSKTLIRVM